jgi:hypothetical protein
LLVKLRADRLRLFGSRKAAFLPAAAKQAREQAQNKQRSGHAGSLRQQPPIVN